MKHKLTLGLAIGLLAVGAVVFWMLAKEDDARPIGELDSVYYSAPGRWVDFYANRAPEGLGSIHLPRPHDGSAFRSSANPQLQGFVRTEVCGECHADKLQGLR